MAHGDEKSTETMEGLLSYLETPKIFSPEQLQTFTSKFSSSLGSGGFGDVYKGTLDNGVQVAVKVLKGALLSDGVIDQFKAELRSLGNIHHKHVVKLYGFCFEQNMKALVYEFMENGSLDKLLYGNQSIAWETLCNIAVGTAKGLAYLHEDCQPSIIHYDVKPANILLDSKFSPKVGDFGLAKLLNQDTTHITESRFRGTPNYGAPELCLPYSPITDKCDVFSFGISLFDIIGRRKHAGGEGEKWFPVQVWKKFKEEKQEEIIQECGIQENDGKQAKRILLIALQCVQFSSGDRPSMSRVVRLLEGTEEVKLPPNPFSYLASSSAVTEEDKKEDKLLPDPSLHMGSSSAEEDEKEDELSPNSLGSSSAVTEEDEKEDKLSPNPCLVHMGSSSVVTEEDEKGNISRTTLGPWGDDGGILWDDGIFVGIKKIEVFEGINFLIGIQVWYCGKDGESIEAMKRGNCEQTRYKIATIELDYPSEYLMRVTGFYEDGHWGFTMVRSLCFFTNKKIYGPFGEENLPIYGTYTYFTSKNDGKDGKIVGFHGREFHGREFHIFYLQAIGVHMEYNKDHQGKLNVIKPKKGIWDFGGDGGYSWDDGASYGIKKIEIYEGMNRNVLSMQIWYCGNDGDPIWSERHGSVDLEPHTRHTIELDYPSEYLVRVTGYHGYGRFYGFGFGESSSRLVRSLCFFSNKKKYGPFGKEEGTYFSTNENVAYFYINEIKYGKDEKVDEKVIGFHGRADRFLNAIGVYTDDS